MIGFYGLFMNEKFSGEIGVEDQLPSWDINTTKILPDVHFSYSSSSSVVSTISGQSRTTDLVVSSVDKITPLLFNGCQSQIQKGTYKTSEKTRRCGGGEPLPGPQSPPPRRRTRLQPLVIGIQG